MTDTNDNQKLTIIEDVACTLCGCVCDDLRIGVRDNNIQSLENTCQLAEDWLWKQNERLASVCKVGSDDSTLEDAVAKSFELIQQSKNPLIYGLSSSSTPGQRAACHLADRIGAVIDTSASTCHAPSIMAVQRLGESTSSLGEIKNRSDLVIFWGSNPVQSHPRHLERYSNDPNGEFLDAQDRDRYLIVVDTVRTETAELADLFIQIEPDSDFEVLWALRSLVQGKQPVGEIIGGVPNDVLTDLAGRMINCQHGAIFFGLGLASGTLPHLNVEALLSLATDLHQHTRFVVRRMRRYGDVAGADSVLCWQTGYPFSVNLNRDYPRYNPGEYSAGDMLARHEPDLAILIGSDGLQKLPAAAINWLANIPTIALLHEDSELPFEPTVKIPVATYGVNLPGTAYRMDETPIPLRAYLETDLPSDEEVLKQLIELVMTK